MGLEYPHTGHLISAVVTGPLRHFGLAHLTKALKKLALPQANEQSDDDAVYPVAGSRIPTEEPFHLRSTT
jgi:hypothetical protein